MLHCCVLWIFESFVVLYCILSPLCHLVSLNSFGRSLEWPVLLSVQGLEHFKDWLLTRGAFLASFLHIYSVTDWQSALGSKLRPYTTSTVLSVRMYIFSLGFCCWLWSHCFCGLDFVGSRSLLPTSMYSTDFPQAKLAPLWLRALTVFLTNAFYPWLYLSLWIFHSSSLAVTHSLLPPLILCAIPGWVIICCSCWGSAAATWLSCPALQLQSWAGSLCELI